MTLQPGSRLGSCEIVSHIGAGGMGEVYRAHDSRLNRDVAIKVLPELFALDPDRLARFTREAQTLAALNHPNIAAIYGIEDRALIMELVEGEDLSAHIARGPLPLAEALSAARQIAEALEAAHEQGIVHRDLKPANIKIRPDETVKVLDFGLAKATGPDAAGLDADAMRSPTLTARATYLGTIIGTAAYMAPEQARGKAIDKRADVWAFGVVLYEMLTGRRLFKGSEVSDVMAAVLRQDIDFTALPPETPAAVRRLLERCLDRDVKQRLRDIGEARVLLSGPMRDGPASAALPAGVLARRWATVAPWLAAGVAAGVAVWALAGRSPATSDDRLPQVTLRRMTQVPGPETQPDISPDGRQVLYTSTVTGHRNIYLLRVGGARALNLTANSGSDDEQARFSPDGEKIVFRSTRDRGGLFVMGATGESVRRLTTAGFDPAWSRDGRFIAYSTEAIRDPYGRLSFAELWTVEVATGKTTRVFAGDAVQPAWSPDGTRIAFWANDGGQRDVWTIPAAGGPPQALTKDSATDWSPEWSPDGRWMYFETDRSGGMNVWRVPIDPRTGEARGEAQPVTNGVRALGYGRFSADGSRMIVMGYDRTTDITVADFDPAHPQQMVPRSTLRNQVFATCDPSPDGELMACGTKGAQEDLLIVRSDGTDARRLTDDAFKDRAPTWSPDGRSIAFYSTRSGRWESWAIEADGSGLRQLTNIDKDTEALTWSPDGKRVVTASLTTHTIWRLDPTRLNTLESAEALAGPPAVGFETVTAWSASGTLLGGATSLSPSTSTPAVWDLSNGTLRTFGLPAMHPGTAWISFFPDSRRLLVTGPTHLMLVDLADGRVQPLRPLQTGDRYGLSRDGRTLLIQHPVFDSDIWLMELKK